MKTKTEYLSFNLALALLLVLSLLLSACGGSQSPTIPQTEAIPAPTQAPAAEAPTAAAAAPAATEAPVAPAAEAPPAQAPSKAPAATQPPAGEIAAPPEAEPGTWLVMLYQNADDEVLERDIFVDLNEAEVVGSTDQVTIVSQLDRLAGGGFDGDGDIGGAKRYLVTQDDDLEKIGSTELEDLGEIDMADPQTLFDFITWAIQTYPAEKYVLILSDHGSGWVGGWNDNDPVAGNAMPMELIDQAITASIQTTGIGQFELIGFDACLMSQLEALSAVAPHARYGVASAEVEPALGWAYASFLGALTSDPAISGRDLAQTIVDSYIEQDYRIVDDASRRTYSQELGATGPVSAEELAAAMGQNVTLTAVDLSQIVALNAALNDLAEALAAGDPAAPAEARAYAQHYDNIFGKETEPSYIDLGHFAALLAETSSEDAVRGAAQAVQEAIQGALVAEKHGPKLPGSTGMSVFFPNAELYNATFISNQMGSYPQFVARFAAASLWDDFLTAFYTGKAMDAGSANLSVLEQNFAPEELATLAESSQPEAGAAPQAPAAGEITVQPLELSATEINTDGTITINTTVSGQNIAYIYYYTIYIDEAENASMLADIGFVDAEAAKEVGGVTFPDWGDGEDIPVSVDWEPTLYYMSDGDEANDQFALFEPDTYGATYEEDIFTVYGEYTPQGSEPLEAFIEFAGTGEMMALWVTSDENTGPRQATPEHGDTFTMWNQWLEPDQEDFGYFAGGTMTFGDTPFTIQPYAAFAGEYLLGIVAVDFDGNMVSEFAPVTVTP